MRELLVTELFDPLARPQKKVISFSANGRGLPIVALKNKSADVPNGSVPAMQGVAAHGSIDFRVMWPGYDTDLERRTVGSVQKMDRAKLAAEVASCVIYFIYTIRTRQIRSNNPSMYGILENEISANRVFLEGIVNTSGRYWQPILYISDQQEDLELRPLHNF